MKNKTTRFLIVSLIGVALLCVFAFSFLAVYMNRLTADTISKVGRLYMSSTSTQVSNHFGSIIGLRMDQLEALARKVPGEDIHTDQAKRDALILDARSDFEYLAFYRADNTFDMLYGSELTVISPDTFLASLLEGENKVATGTNAFDEKVVLLGVPVSHSSEEEPCVALVAGVPVSYIRDHLSLEENSDNAYSFIIRKDGTFVLRTMNAYRDSYFERVLDVYEDVNGISPDQYVGELSESMALGTDYSSELTMKNGGDRYRLYATSLPYTEWYLITFMPYSTVDAIVSDFSRELVVLTSLSAAVVLVVLLLVFCRYFGLTHQQLREVEKARAAEEHARLEAEKARSAEEHARIEAEKARSAEEHARIEAEKARSAEEHARIEAERSQREAEHANRAKSEFLSNMSHDIRTPMNAIVGMTAIATANIDDRQQVENCLKKITLSSKHLLGLINDVLDMSKIESGKMTLNPDQLSLREVVDGIVSICQPQVRAKRQQFDVSIHDISTENVICDGVRLNQVLINLLSNAIKFTPDGGEICMALYEEDSPKGEDYVRIHIRVKDNGIGMSEEFQKRIFDSFSREDSARVHRTEGTGLGMAITKFIVVDAMQGTIDVESRQGKGTEFHITLDLERGAATEEDMILPNWDMLVVDDDRQLCESTVASLASIGVSAEWALDGGTALDMVSARQKSGNNYHVILLDWKLPDTDGVTVAQRIREMVGGGVPILLISAYDWGEIEQKARAAGINGFISKPLFRSTLFNSLRQFAGMEQRREEPVRPEAGRDLTGKRLLLAEDNELNWEVASELLSEEGLELEWAQNGQLCVEKLLASPVGYYDAILMDLRMPVMGGHEAAQVIRSLDRADRDLPIIAMTADAFAEDVKRSLECGMNAHVAKPIDVREVMRLLDKFIP